jgi:tetratricopeptide (TPR) repeat protein
MQAALRDFRDEHPAEAIRMRVGINTGEVLVGTVAGTDYTAMGDVVNTASRLQELAPAGAVLVGDATRQLCGPTIRFRPFDAVQLRGREQATDVWQAAGVDLGVVARRWASDVAFVGRRSELAVLAAVTSTVLSGRSAIVAVSGEAGIGKSRLVQEAVRALAVARPETVVLEGACAPYGESNVWWPVAGSVLTSLGLDRADTSEEARRRVVRRLEPVAEVEPGGPEFERMVELVMHLLGQPSALDALGPAATRDAVVAGLVAALRRRAVRTPVVVWVDDVQWAAPVLLEVLESVARQLAGLPVLIVTTHRPESESTADWPPPVDPALTLSLSLEPLPVGDSAALAIGAAGTELPEQVLETITARSGGNPLFLIELARLAASPDGPVGGDLPGTLRALIAARLDRLTAGQRAIVDNAAIIGNQGRIASLRDFAGELGQPYDPDDLDVLDASGLLVRDGSLWRFRSDVVREVAYHTLTKQSRAQRHAGVARFLAMFQPTLVDRRAHHAATAAEIRAELGPVPGVQDDIGDEAVELLTEAARRWHHQGADRRALQVTERALGLAPGGTAIHRQLLLLRIESLVDLHQLRRARSLTSELIHFADVSGDRVVRGEVARLLGQIEQMDGDLVAARRELGRAVDEFRQLGDDAHLAEALRARGFAEVFGGSLTDAEWFLGEAEALFDRLGDLRGRAWVQQNRAWVSFLSGDHAESERRLGDAIEAFGRLDDRAGRAWSSGLLAYVYHFARRNDEALELAASALDDARQWGDDWGSSMMLNLQASIRLWRGELDAARTLADRSLAGFRRIDDRFGMVQALGTQMRADVGLGRFADADRGVEEVLALSDSFGRLAYALIAAAGVSMHLGHGERAAELAAKAIDRMDVMGANVDEARVVLSFGRLLAGDADAALAHLVDVDVDASPFALAARATALVLIGDRSGALADVRRVESMDEVSYWDRSVAAIAGLVAADGDERERRRAVVAGLVDRLTDVILTTYANDVLRTLDGGVITPAERHGSHAGQWADLATSLSAVAVG